METGRARRKCLRIPVYLDVRLDLTDGSILKGKVINLSTEGICVKTDDPLFAKELITAEFIVPDTLNSVRLAGEVVWYRFDRQTGDQDDPLHFSGIKFIDLKESYRSLIRYYTLKMLYDEDLVREQGVGHVLGDVLNLPPKEKEMGLNILTQKGFITEKEKLELISRD